MPKSADKNSASSAGLNEESDVIELTEEVPLKSSPVDDVESLGLEMPEFKVPDTVVDASALINGETAPSTEVTQVEEDRGATSSEEEEEDLSAPKYDRQAMVKTIQMEAIDRETFESLVQSRMKQETEAILQDARFSPEIILGPPSLLVRKWQEGLPGSVLTAIGASPAAKEIPKSPPSSAKIRVPDLPTKSADEIVGANSDTLEIEAREVAIEEDERPEESSPPAPQAVEQAPVTPGSGGDDEMSGLVKELLEEKKKEKKEAQTQMLRPRDIWFQEVFSEEYLRTVPPNIAEMTSAEADFIERSLKLKKQSRILDLACGFGRHSIELADRGYEMVGLDLSMQLLQRALASAQERALTVKFIHGDMRELNFANIFDGCFVWDTSLGYFDDRTNLRVLQGVHRSLKTGGRLVVDVINRDYVVRQTPTRLWWEGKGCIFLEESEFDYPTSTLHAKRSFIYEDGTPPLEQNSYVRLYSAHELRQMLHVAGFKVLEISGERHHKGYFLGAASSRIIVVAEKRLKKKPVKG